MTSSFWRLVWSLIVLTSVTIATPDVATGDQVTPKTETKETPVESHQSQPTEKTVLDTTNFDLNQDGCISGKPELDAFRYHVTRALEGTPNSALRAHSIVHRADVNRDGKICWCDFITIYLHDSASRGRHSFPFMVIPDNVMFTQLDMNNDGKLSGDEKTHLVDQFATCLPLPEAESIVADMDGLINKDESISLEEFSRYLQNPPPFRVGITDFLNQHPPPPPPFQPQQVGLQQRPRPLHQQQQKQQQQQQFLNPLPIAPAQFQHAYFPQSQFQQFLPPRMMPQQQRFPQQPVLLDSNMQHYTPQQQQQPQRFQLPPQAFQYMQQQTQPQPQQPQQQQEQPTQPQQQQQQNIQTNREENKLPEKEVKILEETKTTMSNILASK